jgi:hypothetical protein
LVGGLALAYVVGLLTIFLIRGKRWPATALLWLTVLVLAVDLPLCWLVLGVDGLVRDGGPLVVAALLALAAIVRRPAPR